MKEGKKRGRWCKMCFRRVRNKGKVDEQYDEKMDKGKERKKESKELRKL